jgi:hypothetical protein
VVDAEIGAGVEGEVHAELDGFFDVGTGVALDYVGHGTRVALFRLAFRPRAAKTCYNQGYRDRFQTACWLDWPARMLFDKLGATGFDRAG